MEFPTLSPLLITFVIAATELAKGWNMPKWAYPIFAIMLTVITGTAMELAPVWAEKTLTLIMLGITITGGYRVVKESAVSLAKKK